MSRRLRTCSSVGYFACWILTGALVAVVLGTILWESVATDATLLRGVDDDWTLLTLPVGAVFGAWVARRTRGARRFQLACLPAGVAVLCFGVYQALESFARARELTGTGPFAGLGEDIAGLLFSVVAVTGGLIVGIGVCGTIAGEAERGPAGRQPTRGERCARDASGS